MIEACTSDEAGNRTRLTTPVPARRRFSSLEAMMLNTLVRPYIWMSLDVSFSPLHYSIYCQPWFWKLPCYDAVCLSNGQELSFS